MSVRIHFISAGAGSGKTHRLTQILFEKLSSGSVRPEGVIATTFTKKAATELRERVRTHLLKKEAYELASAMGQARIGTVNSVCGGLVERFAFEAGLATQLQVLDEPQAELLIRQSVDAVCRGTEVSDLVGLVNKLGIEEWTGELTKLLAAARANDIPPEALLKFARQNADDLLGHFPKPVKRNLSKALQEAIEKAMPACKAALESKVVKKTQEYLALLQSVQRNLEHGDCPWGQWVKLSKVSPESGLREVAESVAELASQYDRHAHLHDDIRRYLDLMFTLCANALKQYDETKREKGVIDFTDQEHLLLKVLDDKFVVETLREEVDLLLVDEFQDTSPIQLALFLRIAKFAKEIYWVGDIKQAIYGFRGSDTELMKAILSEMASLGVKPEYLNSSWRSRPALVQLVNAVFTNAFKEIASPGDVALKAERPEKLNSPVVGNWILGGRNKEDEFAALACGIRRLIEDGTQIAEKGTEIVRSARLGDIAILCRSNDNVKEVASTLRRCGVPTATTQPGLLATPEATLALACLRRLNDPSDTIATAEIVSLADCTEPEDWVADRLKHLASEEPSDKWLEDGPAAHPLVAMLAGMRADLPMLAPHEALQEVIAACGLSAIVLQWKQSDSIGRIRLANLEALLALATQYEDACRSAQHSASISGLLIWLGEQQKNEQDGLAQPAVEAVKVMTHHAAKGLEWPIVVLMDLSRDVWDRTWSISALSLVNVDIANPLKDRFIRYWPWPFGLLRSVPIAEHIADSESGRAMHAAAVEEDKRLLYVSMTRARDLLILARSDRNPTGEWIDTLDAPWLLPDDGSADLILPGGKGKVSGLRWDLEPTETGGESLDVSKAIFWFKPPRTIQPRLPLVFNPSAAVAPACRVGEKLQIGDRISVGNGTDMAALGTALHACIAASFTDERSPLSPAEIQKILDGHGVGGCVSPAAVRSQTDALQKWISGRWGSHKAHSEIPVESTLESGQILSGRIDLLIELKNGWILLDHKSNPKGVQHWEEIARDYAGQLAAYKTAVEQATEKPVLESWLFFPVSAGAVRVDIQ